jgi:HK97 gp10 family phage protein
VSDVQIVGLQELGAKIDKLFKEDAKKAISAAIKPAAEVFRREIRAKAPVRQEAGAKGKNGRQPGYLKKHIGRWIRKNSDGSLSAHVGPTKSAFYAKYYEFGTNHQPARPFMRPVFDGKKDEAEKVFATVLENEIKKALP